MKIGVIADTHGSLTADVVERLQGVDHILHAGDIGSDDVLEELGQIAAVTAVMGNADRGKLFVPVRAIAMVELAGRLVVVTHQRPNWDAVQAWCRERLPDVVVSGHTHRPAAQLTSGVLFLNPGGAGRKRINLPRSMALLHLDSDVTPEIIILEEA